MRARSALPPHPVAHIHSIRSHARAVHQRRYAKPTSGSYESLNYDEAENNSIRNKYYLAEGERATVRRREQMVTWVVVLTTGFLIGSIAYFTTFANAQICHYKFLALNDALERGAYVEGWLRLSAFVVPLATIAALLTRWSPEAAGSGIPHVKAYLNGNRLDGALRPRTLVAKVIGIICCVATGMPAGREGPMVHAGAIVANVIGTGPRLLQDALHVNFHNDFVRRNFVSMGAAAGVSAAFHAPIGGILFSLEEVSTFWNPQLTLLTFFMVAFAALTVAMWTDGISGTFDDVGLVMWRGNGGGSFHFDGSGAHASRGRSPYQWWEVLLFVAIAVIAGLGGATFNELNKRLTIRRKRLLSGRPTLKGLEAVLSIWLVLSLFYGVCFAFPCTDATDGKFDGHVVGDEHAIYLSAFQCAQPSNATGADGAHRRLSASGSHGSGASMSNYNALATLLMQPQEGAIKQLFSRGTAGYFEPTTVLFFAVLYFFSAIFVYGVAVPSGLFVPGMLIGGGLGRFVGELVYVLDGPGSRVDPGMYALVGAAGILGGVTRMTMSLAVIILEISNDIDLMIPIMLSVGIAKQVGDQFNKSLYDIHIALSGVPMLEADEIASTLPSFPPFGRIAWSPHPMVPRGR